MAKKRFPWVIYLVLLFLIGALAVAPIVSVIIAGAIASTNGCKLDEGSVHPCIIAGHDYGETLYTMGVLGWLMLITLPLGAGAGLVWLIIFVLHYSKWRTRPSAAG